MRIPHFSVAGLIGSRFAIFPLVERFNREVVAMKPILRDAQGKAYGLGHSIRARSSARNMLMPKTPAAVSDRLEELEKRLASIEKRVVPSPEAIVTRFFMACTHRDDGAETSVLDIFPKYERWCREHYPLDKPLDVAAFREQFARCCGKAGIEIGRVDALYCFGLAFSA